RDGPRRETGRQGRGAGVFQAAALAHSTTLPLFLPSRIASRRPILLAQSRQCVSLLARKRDAVPRIRGAGRADALAWIGRRVLLSLNRRHCNSLRRSQEVRQIPHTYYWPALALP